MTTIAADAKEGVMVADSMWSDGDEKGRCRKVWRFRGELYGFAGNHKDIMAAREWFKRGATGATPAGNVTALILSAKGIFTWAPPDGMFKCVEPQFAIGTGGKAARAAMLAGASCRDAVRIACKIDAESGAPARVYRLET